MRQLGWACRLCLAWLLVAAVACPQASTSAVSGTVRDATGAVIPSAAVALTNTNTNIASRTTANQVGFYMFPGVLPGLDSIQEFKVENNNSSAKFTRPTALVLTTRGGANQFNGAAFETNRNNAVGLARQRQDTWGPPGAKPPYLNRNEFGASAGGPV